jgi:hypothetical protein
MTRRTVDVRGRRLTVAVDDAAPRGRRLTVVVRGRAVDELSGEPVAGPLGIAPAGSAFARASSRALVAPRRAAGGVVGLVGVPLVALPQVRTRSYQVGLRVSAPGYHPLAATLDHGPVAGLPGTWQPADLGTLRLHRQAVRFSGRVVRDGTPPAVAGGQVHVVQAWRALPSPTASAPALASAVLSLTPPVYARRTAAASSAAPVTLGAVAAQGKQTRRDAAAGATEVALSDAVGLNPGTLLRFAPADPDRAEVLPVRLIDGVAAPSPAPASPVVVTLAHPLAGPHAVRTQVEVVTAVAGAAQGFDFDAEPADRCILVSALGGLGAAGWIRLEGGGPAPPAPPAPEFHRPALPQATTGPDGYFRLPPLDRLATVRVRAAGAGLTPVERDVSLGAGPSERQLDFVLS